MKKMTHVTGIWILAMSLPFLSFAKSRISISTSTPGCLKVVIDGYKFYSNDNTITISDIPSGTHSIKVFYVKRTRSNRFASDQRFRWTNLLNNRVTLRDNIYYDMIVSRFGRVFTDRNEMGMMMGNDEEEYDGVAFSEGFDENYDDRRFFQKQWDRNSDMTNDRSEDNDELNGGRGHDYDHNTGMGNGRSMMNSSSYDQLKEMVTKEMTDDGKLNLIKDATPSSWITAQQAKDLGSAFLSEFTKVDFAKYIYSRVADKKNFFLIYSIFQSSFSKQEVSDYVKNQDYTAN